LALYHHGQHQWTKTTPTDQERAEIRTELDAMQGRRCAYCECDLDQHGQHIEHFRQRSRYPQGTFAWDNLFLSCRRSDSCGNHKDTCGPYNHTDLIKPDIEDPEHFFLFGQNGTINLRQGLNSQEAHRAEETLRIFNLDAQWGPLRQMRKVACIGYVETAIAFQEMAQLYPQADWWPLLQDELAYIEHLPFRTAIKHTLTPV
jgi:uncharacterized protein (TIGR02646 family)